MTLPENHRKLEATEALGALADEAGLPLIELKPVAKKPIVVPMPVKKVAQGNP